MNDPHKSPKQFSRRTPRFEWSAWLAAAFVLLVVAPALHAQETQLSARTLAPFYAAFAPQQFAPPHFAPQNKDHAVHSLEAALAVLENVPQPRATSGIRAPQLQRADGSYSQTSMVEFDRTLVKLRAIDAPRLFTSHVVLATALTAHQSAFLSGTRTNRSHE